MHEVVVVFGIRGDELAADSGCAWVEAQSVDKELDSCFGVCDFRELGCYHFDSDLLVVCDLL